MLKAPHHRICSSGEAPLRVYEIKGLIFEGDGFCLVYKQLSTDSRFQWPRSEDELKEVTPQQFKWLMEGLSIAPKKKIKELTAPPRYLL